MFIVIIHDGGREPHCAAFRQEWRADRLCTVVNRHVRRDMLGYYHDA